jgi:hypothetical protein
VTDLVALAKKVCALPPADRLLLAAELLRAGKPELAETVAEQVVLELSARRLLAPKATTAAESSKENPK